ncbi:MAG: SPOR domain-containing protein [Mucilaginibacter sp.]
MKRITLYIFCFLLFAVVAKAQERGKVEVVKDPRIDTLIAKRLSLKVSNPAAGFSSNGYRIQIFSGPARSDAYQSQAKFQAKFPGVHSYMSYTVPNFKVKVGDFRTKLEAEKFKQELQTSFSGLFIIPEKINIPKSDPSND